MATYQCTDDASHHSTDPQVCTICGALIEAVPPPAAPVSAVRMAAAAPMGGAGVCSNCGVTRVPGELFCENCGVDFATGKLDVADAPAPTPPPVAAPPPEADKVLSAPATVAMPVTKDTGQSVTVAGAPTGPALEALVTVDMGTRERPDDAVPPTDKGERIYLLDLDRLLIGRGSSTIKPQIVLKEDSGVSRAHAELIRHGDRYGVRDLGSANGTLVNGEALADQELKPVKVGDQIGIGFWYTITLRDH